MNGEPRIVQVGGKADMSRGFRRRVALVRAPFGGVRTIGSMAAAADAFAGLSRCLCDAVDANVTTDGRVDLREVARHVIHEMKRHPKTPSAAVQRFGVRALAERIEDEKCVRALEAVLDKAFAESTHDNAIDMKDVAAFVLAELRRPTI